MFKWIDFERLIHSTKTAIACLFGFLLTQIISFPADQWIIITILVVMCAQIYVGSVLQKAYMRFLGTAIGCLFAAFTLVAVGHTSFVIGVAIGLASFIFSYIATGQENLAYAGTLGAVTTIIILLGDQPTVLFAAGRFLEISVGILIASLVSQYILPIRARDHLRRAQVVTLEQLRDYYTNIMSPNDAEIKTINDQELDEAIVKTLIKQRQLAKESSHEQAYSAFDASNFTESLYHERIILRAMAFMHHALIHLHENTVIHSPALTTFNETILQAFNVLIKAIETDNTTHEHIHVPTLITIKNELQNTIGKHTYEKAFYLHGFLFSAEVMTSSLMKLAKLYKVPAFTEN